MEYLDVLRLYDELVPYKYEAKDTSHGEDDYRVAIFAEWTNKKRQWLHEFRQIVTQKH